MPNIVVLMNINVTKYTPNNVKYVTQYTPRKVSNVTTYRPNNVINVSKYLTCSITKMSLNTHRTASTTRSPRGRGGAHGRHHPAGRRLHGEERHLREHGGAEPAHPGGGHAPRHGPGGLEDHPGRVRGSPHTLRYTPMWPLVT